MAIKFFELSKCLARDGATATATSGTETANNALTHRRQDRWQSFGSDDSTQEILTITLPAVAEISWLLIGRHNMTDLTAQYWDGAAWQFFATIETANQPVRGGRASFYHFTPVTTDQIRVRGTQAGGAEKYIEAVVTTNLLGEFSHYGIADPNVNIDYNETTSTNLAGREFVQKGQRVATISLTMPYIADQSDVDLVNDLRDADSFLIWPCGGAFGANNFRVTQPEWELHSWFKMAVTGNAAANYYKNIHTTGATTGLRLVEVE